MIDRLCLSGRKRSLDKQRMFGRPARRACAYARLASALLSRKRMKPGGAPDREPVYGLQPADAANSAAICPRRLIRQRRAARDSIPMICNRRTDLAARPAPNLGRLIRGESRSCCAEHSAACGPDLTLRGAPPKTARWTRF